MVNLVIVSHSARLGEGVGELARQMLMNDGCKLAIAAGIDDPASPIGTDPLKVMAAIESVADTDHVLVMMDIGSALLSAETALDLLDPAIAAKVRLCAAPLVEGTLAATVSAAAGSGINKVIEDAMNALEAKRVQLGLPSPAHHASLPPALADDREARSVSVVIQNPNGLHVRPASKLVAALAGFNANLVLEKGGKCVTPDSLNQIALLQVRRNDTLKLLASGPDADAALATFQALAAENFGEIMVAVPGRQAASADRVQGEVALYPRPQDSVTRDKSAAIDQQQRLLKRAIDRTLDDLSALTTLAKERFSADIAAIFSGHHTLLDDPDLYATACDIMRDEQCGAERAWHQVLTDLSQQYRHLDDTYLQARYSDIDDILHRTLRHFKQSNETLPQFSGPTILVADDIFPSTVLQLDARQVKGICLQTGSEHSHSAIIARQAGIAMLCQQSDILATLQNGETVTLDIPGKRVIRG